MRIGYSVEGRTDRAVLMGLHKRWCPYAVMIPGHVRGSTSLSRRREIGKTCDEWMMKGVDVMVFMTDGNTRDWREVQREERERIPGERRELAIVGVPDRNIECWICAFPQYLAERFGVAATLFEVDDPKGPFEAVMAITAYDPKEAAISTLVCEAPLHRWLRSRSFADFYSQIRAMSHRQGCTVENLQDI